MLKCSLRFLIVFPILAALSSTVFAAPVTMLDRVLVVVDDEIITLGEYEVALRSMQEQLSASGEQAPSAKILKEKVLEQLVFSKLLQLHAKNSGINVTETMVNQAMERLAKQNNLTVREIFRKLKKDGVSEKTFRNDLKKQLLVQGVIERDVKREINVLGSEIDGVLKNIATKKPNRTYKLSHIMLPVNEEATAADIEQGRESASRLRKRIISGKISFDAAVNSYSSATDSESTGDLGWKTNDQLPALFSEALQEMDEGDISEPLVSPGGIHLLKLVQLKGAKRELVNQVRARHILFKATNKVDIDHAMSEMKKIKQRLIDGEDFGELATEISQDSSSAIHGGELGWMGQGDTVPAFEQAMYALQVGEISQPVVSQFGVHLIQLEEKRLLDISEKKRRDEVRQQIGKRKVAEKYDQFLKQLKSAAFIEYRVPVDEI